MLILTPVLSPLTLKPLIEYRSFHWSSQPFELLKSVMSSSFANTMAFYWIIGPEIGMFLARARQNHCHTNSFSLSNISPTVGLPIPNLLLRTFSAGLGTDSAHLINSILFSNDNSILWRFVGLSDIVMFAISCVFHK